MPRLEKFQLVIKKTTYDILSANTEFYAYQDSSRLYTTFDKLIYEEDVHIFNEHVKAMDESSFLLRMIRLDGSIQPFFATLKEDASPELFRLMLVDVEQLAVIEEETARRLVTRNKLLELYGDDFLVYDAKTQQVRLLSKYNIATEEKRISLDEFETLLKNCASKEDASNISAFIKAMRTGKRYFDICIDGCFMEEVQSAKYTLIRCAANYENGELSNVVGYIRKDSERQREHFGNVDIDFLTGVLSKNAMTNLAIRLIDVEKRPNISIAIVDVDYFKKVNDTYGHMIGDETLKKVAAVMKSEVGDYGVVGRIGGDEFFIVFYDVYDLEESRELLRSIKSTIGTAFQDNDEGLPPVTLSIGCAAYPKDADNYADLFALADFALYRAKEKGRNRYIIYDQEKHGSLMATHQKMNPSTRINNRGDMSRGDILCVIMDRVCGEEDYPLYRLLDDVIENFDPQRIAIYDADCMEILHMTGVRVLSKSLLEETQEYIGGACWKEKAAAGMAVINNVSIVENWDQKVYELMQKQGIQSCIHIPFEDKNGVHCVVSFEAVNKKIVWNSDHLHYFRLMAKMLSQYDVMVNRI